MKNNSSDLHKGAKARRHEGTKARKRESTNVAKGFRLKAQKPSALEKEERPERTFKRDRKKAGNKTRMEQFTDQ
jgi:hypothetical protein